MLQGRELSQQNPNTTNASAVTSNSGRFKRHNLQENSAFTPNLTNFRADMLNSSQPLFSSKWKTSKFPTPPPSLSGKFLDYRIQVFAYETGFLFPHIPEDANSTYSGWEVTSPVVGARISKQPFNETIDIPDGVRVTLRSAIYSHNIRPVFWDTAGGNVGKGMSKLQHGAWSTDGCRIIRILSSEVVFVCSKLAHYALLQDVSGLQKFDTVRGADFRLSAPAVYVGSFLCVIFLMISIVTWAAHHPYIQTTDKNKHSYVNTWIAIVLLVSLFTVGIYQTESRSLCQGIGIVLHYLSSCVLLWIIVSVTNLYKKVTKALRPPLLSDEPSPDIPVPPKPMLRFYLVGWGIALILCGISAAINIHQYAGYSYCFLAWGPSLGAFYAPCVILVTILGIFCLLTHCMLKSVPTAGSYSEAPANTETTELELLDTASPNSENPTTHSGHTSHLTTTQQLNSERLNDDELSLNSENSESLYDSHHSPITQLRAHEVTMILFVLTWASAAITTASPFDAVIPHHTTLFSLVYALCAGSLGVFIFLFFCFGRSDVREAWRKTSWRSVFCDCFFSKKKLLDDQHSSTRRSGSNRGRSSQRQLPVPANNASSSGSGGSGAHLIPVTNAVVNNTGTTATTSAITINNNVSGGGGGGTTAGIGAQSVHSLNSSRSPTNKSSSMSHNIISPVNNEGIMMKTDNVRSQGTALHLFNLGNVTDNLHYSPEMFYNPKQTGVAKRFFQKQRLKQLIKQNNLELNRENNDSDCNSSILYRPKPANRSNNSGGSDVSSFDPSCLGASSKVNNTNIHVDHNMYSYMSAFNKQVDKTPTPELLCVFGPNKESSDPNRSFSRSPIQTDHIPRIDATNAYQYSSEGSYQTPTHQKLYSIRYNENIDADNILNTSFNRCHMFNDDSRKRQQDSSFAIEDPNSLSKVDNSTYQQRKSVGNKEGLRSSRPGRVRHRQARAKGIAVTISNKEAWSDDDARGIQIDSISLQADEKLADPKAELTQKETNVATNSNNKSPNESAAQSKISPVTTSQSPQQTTLRTVSQVGSQVIESENNIAEIPILDSQPVFSGVSVPSEITSKKQSPTAKQSCVQLPSHPTWPHVLGNSIPSMSQKTTNIKRQNIPWHEDLQAVGSWDSETGEEMSCGDEEGGKRFSICDTSDQASICETYNTSRNSMCSDVSIDGSSIGTSLVAGVDTSPPASLMISDSPFDSPLHRLHQNTPDDASIASSSVTSPLRRPFSPSNFASYIKNDDGLGIFSSELGYESAESGSNKRDFLEVLSKFGKRKNKKVDRGSKSYPDSPASATTPTNIPESVSTDKQLSSIFRRKSNKSLPTRVQKVPKGVNLKQSTVPSYNNTSFKNELDPIINVNFKFKDDANDSDTESIEALASQTDRSSSMSLDPQNRQILMTTPRSEGCSSDSDYAVTFINQEPPVNIAEEFRKREKRRIKKTRRKDSSHRDRIYEDDESTYCDHSTGGPPSNSLQSSPSNTPTTPLLSEQDNSKGEARLPMEVKASALLPSMNYSPASPPPLLPFNIPNPALSPTKPLSTSTPIRSLTSQSLNTEDVSNVANDSDPQFLQRSTLQNNSSSASTKANLVISNSSGESTKVSERAKPLTTEEILKFSPHTLLHQLENLDKKKAAPPINVTTPPELFCSNIDANTTINPWLNSSDSRDVLDSPLKPNFEQKIFEDITKEGGNLAADVNAEINEIDSVIPASQKEPVASVSEKSQSNVSHSGAAFPIVEVAQSSQNVNKNKESESLQFISITDSEDLHETSTESFSSRETCV